MPREREPRWHDLGPVDELAETPLRQVTVGRTRLALSCVHGRFGAISGVWNRTVVAMSWLNAFGPRNPRNVSWSPSSSQMLVPP